MSDRAPPLLRLRLFLLPFRLQAADGGRPGHGGDVSHGEAAEE
jgi:hypothetical protein